MLDLVQGIGGMEGTWKALLPLSSVSVCTLQTGCPFPSRCVCGGLYQQQGGCASGRGTVLGSSSLGGPSWSSLVRRPLSQSVGHPRGEDGGILCNTPVLGLGTRAAEGRGEAVLCSLPVGFFQSKPPQSKTSAGDSINWPCTVCWSPCMFFLGL